MYIYIYYIHKKSTTWNTEACGQAHPSPLKRPQDSTLRPGDAVQIGLKAPGSLRTCACELLQNQIYYVIFYCIILYFVYE